MACLQKLPKFGKINFGTTKVNRAQPLTVKYEKYVVRLSFVLKQKNASNSFIIRKKVQLSL
jgi:hypothetical protein